MLWLILTSIRKSRRLPIAVAHQCFHFYLMLAIRRTIHYDMDAGTPAILPTLDVPDLSSPLLAERFSAIAHIIDHPKSGSWTGWSVRFLRCRARRNDAEWRDREGRSGAFRRKARPRSRMRAPHVP